jgi:hypothetical protein
MESLVEVDYKTEDCFVVVFGQAPTTLRAAKVFSNLDDAFVEARRLAQENSSVIMYRSRESYAISPKKAPPKQIFLGDATAEQLYEELDRRKTW